MWAAVLIGALLSLRAGSLPDAATDGGPQASVRVIEAYAEAETPLGAELKERILVLPPENLTGGRLPLKEFRAAVEKALLAEKIELVAPEEADRFLARHRLRNTGGVSAEAAEAAARELGAGGVLVTSLQAYAPSAPPKLAVSMRLVACGNSPELRWMDGYARSGDDAPGLLGIKTIYEVGGLWSQALKELSASLRAFLRNGGVRAHPCPSSTSFVPSAYFRSLELEDDETYSVVVLPFRNHSGQRNAGESLALELIRQLHALPNFEVKEPGMVRAELLKYRVTMEGGVSLDTARLILELLDADLVLLGTVFDFAELSGPTPLAAVNFTTQVLDRRNSEVVWQSTSQNRADDAAWAFGLGTVGTANGLACRMARAIGAVLVNKDVSKTTPWSRRVGMGHRFAAKGGFRPPPGASTLGEKPARDALAARQEAISIRAKVLAEKEASLEVRQRELSVSARGVVKVDLTPLGPKEKELAAAEKKQRELERDLAALQRELGSATGPGSQERRLEVREKELAAKQERLAAWQARLEAVASRGEPLKVGEAGRMQIAEALQNKSSEIDLCVYGYLSRSRQARVEGDLLLAVDAAGRVERAALAYEPLAGSWLERCLREAAQGWKFPSGGEGYELELPLALAPREH